jgi:BAH domain
MLSLLWYYRPEHTEQGRQPNHMADEIFASKHKDHSSVACIEDKCYVLTFNEYCRYERTCRAVNRCLNLRFSLQIPGESQADRGWCLSQNLGCSLSIPRGRISPAQAPATSLPGSARAGLLLPARLRLPLQTHAEKSWDLDHHVIRKCKGCAVLGNIMTL